MPALTTGEQTLLHTHPHKVKEYLAILHPSTVLACQVNGSPGDPVTQINYDNVTEGSYTDVVAGMTLWVGTAAGKRDKGTCRVRKAPTSSILYVSEDSAIDWQDDDYLTVVENYELWVKYPRIVVDGSLTFYKDWDVPYSDQHSKWAPVAILGPPDCQFIDAGTGLATAKFVGEFSYPVAPGASLSTYSWIFPGGTPSSSSSAGTAASPVSVTWDTPGEYWVSLTVTDSNGKSHTGRRPVWIFPADRNAATGPYSRVKMLGRSGDIDSHGHTVSIEVRGDADQLQFPDRALVVYFTEDWYGTTKQSIGGNFPYRQHIKFAGYVSRETTAKDPRTSMVTFEAATVHAQMGSREGFSSWIKEGTSAGNWCQATNLTADRAALSLCRYNSTLLDIADVTPTGDTLRIKSQEFAAKTTLLQQLQTLYDDLFAFVACDKQGRVYFEIDPQMRSVASRSSIPVVITLTHADWREKIDLPRPQEPQTSFINLEGVYHPGAPADVVPILSKAPGDTPGYMGTPKEITGLILAGQSDGNEKAGLALARDNNEFPEVNLPLAGLWDVFDIVPQEYIQFSLAASDTKRGIVWSNQKLIPRRVELRLEETPGGRIPQVDITVEKDSFGPSGVDGDYPDDVPPVGPYIPPSWPGPPPPPGDEKGDGSLLYLTDYASGHLIRTRNARESNPALVEYEDLGFVMNGLRYLTLDPWDPKNSALACGDDGVYLTRNLNSSIPTWTLEIDLSGSSSYYATMAAGSIVQKDLWMVAVRHVYGIDPAPRVYYTTDLVTWNYKAFSEAGTAPKCEWSAHAALTGWVTWGYGDGTPYVSRTTTGWSTYNNHSLDAWLGNTGGQMLANPHHRFLENPTDQHGLYGQHQGYNNRAVFVRLLADPPGDGTVSYPGGSGTTNERVMWLGSYTWGTTKYWCLTYDSDDGKCKFYVSDDAITWVFKKQFTVAGETFISGWPYLGERFYATQNGASAPLLISDDRGDTWQEQTGNWASLGYSGDIRCCVPVWIA